MISIFWFRNDLRFEDNHALSRALEYGFPVLPIYVFDVEDNNIYTQNHLRINIVYNSLENLHKEFVKYNSGIKVYKGKPKEVFLELFNTYKIHSVFTNEEYEPYTLCRDKEIESLTIKNGSVWKSYRDQVIYHPSEILKKDGTPYTQYSAYRNMWKKQFLLEGVERYSINLESLLKTDIIFSPITDFGFIAKKIELLPYSLYKLQLYDEGRNFPAQYATSNLSVYLKFGLISVRNIVTSIPYEAGSFLNEIIWREFFKQILYHFPKVVHNNFKEKYNGINYSNNLDDFKAWCVGKTGYPLVDAGMRELIATGRMHNRVRMITASFLCKHLLIDWRWGEEYFAIKLLDYDLALNNGNWQWVAGTGCDSAPYFRIFNPIEQQKKFDKDFEYIKKWIPEFGTPSYPSPIINHSFARERALQEYKRAISR